MIELDEISQEITIKNFSGGTTVDISGYFMCRAPGTYQQMTALTIIGGGDLNLSPGKRSRSCTEPSSPRALVSGSI